MINKKHIKRSSSQNAPLELAPNKFREGLGVKALLIIALLLTIPTLHVFAAPPFPGGDPGAPIDGGISLLIGAGIAYGAKKAHARKKAKAEKENTQNETGI